VKVVHFRKEPYDVYIGRPSVWGNPHALGFQCGLCHEEHTRSEAVSLYEEYARGNPKLLELIKELPESTVLGCWCKPPLACHGHVIVKLWEEMHSVSDT
jgi:hypothetical protein